MTNSQREKLSAALQARRELAVRLIQDMVRMPSINDETEVQKYITAFWEGLPVKLDVWSPDVADLRQHRAFVEVDYDYEGRNNVVVLLRGAGGGRSLTLNGHMDVVPADPTSTWTHGDPFSGVIENGRIYGRGSVDMKGGLAIAMIVLDALLECGIQLKGDLQLQFVIDEENGGNGTLAAITRGYRSDATIFLEPTSPNYLVVSSRGAHFFRVTVPGVEGGIEYQYTLPNAIDKAMLLFAATKDYSLWRASQAKLPLYDHDPTKIPAAICKIQAGNWPSTLAASCIMEGSIECLPGENIDEVCRQFEDYLLEVARQDSWMKDHPPEIEWFGLRFEAGQTPVDDPLVQQLSEATKRVTGTYPQVVGGGGSDLRLPVLYAHSPSVLFGPTGSPIHTTDEYIEIESVMQVAQILARFILVWCEEADYSELG